MPRFFAKTDKSIKKRFFNPQGIDTTGDISSNAEGDAASTETSMTPFSTYNHKENRLFPPAEKPEDLLEKLLRKAQSASGESCEFYLQQLVNLLTRNPDLVNRAPKGLKNNPLELAIKLGYPRIIQELLALKANVRPEHRYLLEKMKQLLRLHTQSQSPLLRNDEAASHLRPRMRPKGM